MILLHREKDIVRIFLWLTIHQTVTGSTKKQEVIEIVLLLRVQSTISPRTRVRESNDVRDVSRDRGGTQVRSRENDLSSACWKRTSPRR
jgi:hypothetical protein